MRCVSLPWAAISFVETGRNARSRRIAIVHQNPIAREQLLAAPDQAAHEPERAYSDHAPIGDEPGEIVVIAWVRDDGDAGGRSAVNPCKSWAPAQSVARGLLGCQRSSLLRTGLDGRIP